MSNLAGQFEMQPAVAPAAPVAVPENRTHIFVRSKKHWYQWLKWGDYVLYVLIGGCAVLLLILLPGLAAQPVREAVLLQDREQIFSISRAEMAVAGEKELSANGYHYVLIWEDGRIRFSEADCPDKICVRTGWISQTDEIAACVPGHLILKIIGDASAKPDGPDVIVR